MSTETKPAEWMMAASQIGIALDRDYGFGLMAFPEQWQEPIAAIIAKHAPAPTESEAIEVLRALESADNHDCAYDAQNICQMCNAIAKARAVLARHDQK